MNLGHNDCTLAHNDNSEIQRQTLMTTDTDKLAALEELATVTRELINNVVQVNADTEDILKLVNDVTSLNQKLATLPRGRALPHYDLSLAKTNTNHTLPYSPVCGPYNPVAPPVDMHYDAELDQLIGRVSCGLPYEGPPNMVHGAIIAGIYDQLLALVSSCTGKPSFTAYLHTDFRKPTPLYKELTFRAWLDKIDGRKMTIKGHCTLDGEILTETEGLFIQLQAIQLQQD